MRQLLPQSFYILVLLTLVAFLGMIQACQTLGVEQFTKIQGDMSKDEVLDLLGSPNRTERFDGKEKWAYKYFGAGNREELRQVTFMNGRVVSVGEDSDEIQRIKDIQDADKKRMERRKASKSKAPASLEEPVNAAPLVEQPEEPAKPDPRTVEFKELRGKQAPIQHTDE